MKFATHDSGGHILTYGQSPDGDEEFLSSIYPQIVFFADDIIATDETHYVSNGVLTERPLLTSAASWSATTLAANGIAEITFGPGIPSNTTVTVISPTTANAGGAPPVATTVVNDGTFEFSTIFPGTYTVQIIDPFPFKTYTAEVVAT